MSLFSPDWPQNMVFQLPELRGLRNELPYQAGTHSLKTMIKMCSKLSHTSMASVVVKGRIWIEASCAEGWFYV